MIKQPQVSIIIANWNGRHWLETCLKSLKNQTYQDFEIIVVDNGSTDDSVVWLKQQWPQVHVLAQTHNTGFAQANNIGIAATDTPFIVTLNNDTRPHANWLTELVMTAANSNAGMVASCILRWDAPGYLDSAGIILDKAGIAWQRGHNQPVASKNLNQTIFGPSAAAALYRREMLAEIGLFDADYFAYYEDVDLAWRARLAGWDCQYASDAKVEHWHSATAAKVPDCKLYLLSRNKIWTLLKNFPTNRLLYTLPTILFYDFLATAYQMGQAQGSTAIRGRLDALRQREVALTKRPSFVPTIPLAPVTLPWQIKTKNNPLR